MELCARAPSCAEGRGAQDGGFGGVARDACREIISDVTIGGGGRSQSFRRKRIDNTRVGVVR